MFRAFTNLTKRKAFQLQIAGRYLWLLPPAAVPWSSRVVLALEHTRQAVYHLGLALTTYSGQ